MYIKYTIRSYTGISSICGITVIETGTELERTELDEESLAIIVNAYSVGPTSASKAKSVVRIPEVSSKKKVASEESIEYLTIPLVPLSASIA